MTTFKKTRSASQSYGRGRDQVYAPAHYGVFVDGVQVGVIYGSRVCYMETPIWHIALADYKEIKRAGSFADAKQWTLANLDQFNAQTTTPA